MELYLYERNSNGSTSLSNVSANFEYGQDEHGHYFVVKNRGSSSPASLQTYLIKVISLIWIQLPEPNCVMKFSVIMMKIETIGNGWLMGIETSHGPYLTLNHTGTIGGIGMFPGDKYVSK